MNSNERWSRIKDIFESALELSGEARMQYLIEACDGDSAIYSEVESLLASFDSDFLEGAAVHQIAADIVPRPNIEMKKGSTLGNYTIIGELGKGGQGSVFKATDTKLERTVAIKTLPPELMFDKVAFKRFRREAQLASSLDHPNICPVYEFGEYDGLHFIVMQFVDGKNVRELVNGTPLALRSALRIGIQVCDALAAAHNEGIIHRDIKAHNVIVTETGGVKVLDFGLAKINSGDSTENTELTVLGSPYGTPTYAAPEQSRGEIVDHRADIFSAGVLLYELLTGTWPFQGKTAIDVRHAVLHNTPKGISERRGETIPIELDTIIMKALSKTPSDRFQEIGQMRDALLSVLRGVAADENSSIDELLDKFPSAKPYHFISKRKKAMRYVSIAAILVIALAVLGYLVYRRNSAVRQAEMNSIKALDLTAKRKYFEAYDLAMSVLKYRPDDEGVAKIMPTISDTLSVSSNIDGASVYIKRFSPSNEGKTTEREFVGVTPLEPRQIARGDYILEIEKDGYAPYRRSISGSPEIYWDLSFNPPPLHVDAILFPISEIPERMVFVPGGEYKLMSWKKPTDIAVTLPDYFIDRFEVSNREYKEFVSSGGYLKREYWKFPFAREGKPIDWETAMNELKDKTGLPAPRNWVNQNFPDGRSEHPVTEITWYEAAAYAEFRGKSLPSVYQWEKAARNGGVTQSPGEVMPWGFLHANDDLGDRANISGRDTVAVDSFEFGMSTFGCFNMAGNAAEWCYNESNEGFLTAGGSWGDPPYNFGSISAFPAFFSSNKLGFRCAMDLSASQVDKLKIDNDLSVPVYVPMTAVKFEAAKAFYRYDKTPPFGTILEVDETPDWRREKIEFTGMNDEKALAYLYLPKNTKPPYQTIQYLPAGDVYQGFSTVPQHIENFASAQIKAGRAVFAVVLKGFLERPFPADRKPISVTSVRYRDKLINDAIDLSRGLDYLETRKDIDVSRIAYWGYSAGAEFGIFCTALEPRIRALAFMAVGITSGSEQYAEEINPANFAPYIKIPKLLIIGRYDEQYSWKSESEPLVKLLTEPKQLIRYDAGHTPPPEIAVPAISKWLDERLGPVSR